MLWGEELMWGKEIMGVRQQPNGLFGGVSIMCAGCNHDTQVVKVSWATPHIGPDLGAI